MQGLGLSTIPPELLTIEKLKILDFSRNKLRVLPPQFNQYATSLKKLDLSHNEITRLPDYFGLFKQLRTLDISHNQLVTLPDVLPPRITSLRCTSNGLKELFPPSIMQLRFVEELHFSNNPLGQSIHLDVQKWAELNRLDEPDNEKEKG